MRIRNQVLFLSLAVIGACGGGGGGGGGNTPSTTIDSANAEVVATLAIDAAAGLIDVSESGTGIAFARVEGTDTVKGLDLKAFFGRRIRGVISAAATRQVVTTEVDPGPEGGSVTTIWNDKAPEEEVSTGDTFRLTFENYQDSGVTLNGVLFIDQTKVTGDPEFDETWVVGARLNFQSLSVAEAGAQAILNGAMSGKAEQTLTDSILDLKVSTSMADGTSTISTGTATRYVENQAEDFTLTASGAVRDPRIGGLVSFETTTPFTGNYAVDDYPSAGVLLIRGAAKSKIQLTALSATTVRLEVDKDGDGTFETSKEVQWVDLE